MRVLFFAHYSKLYGANRSLLDLIDGLLAGDHTPAVVLPEEGPMTAELKGRGVACKTLGFKWWMGRKRWKAPLRTIVNLAAIPRAVNAVEEWNPDLIHTNSSVLPIGAWAARLTKTPHIWHVREFGKLDYGLVPDFGQRFFESWLSKADAVIAVSNAVRRQVLSNVEVCCTVIYNGVITREQLKRLKVNTQHKPPGVPFKYAMVGLLSPAKGQEEAIRALHLLTREGAGDDEYELLIAGGGPDAYLAYLRDIAERLDVAKITHFLGYVDNPFEVYREADAFIMASRSEAMGRVTAEAMAAALPIIGRNSGATPELVVDGKTGVLYDDGIEGLASQMKRLSRRPDWSRQLGLNGRRKAANRFTIERYVRRVEQLYETVI